MNPCQRLVGSFLNCYFCIYSLLIVPINFYNTFFTHPSLPVHLEEERDHIVTFRKYMAIMFVAFTVGLLFELLFDFKQFEWWTFSFIQLICVVFLILSSFNVNHRLLIILNFIM